MKAHESIRMAVVKLAFDGLFIHVIQNGVVNIQESNRILTHTGTDKIAQAAININLARYRNTLAGKPAVNIAGKRTVYLLSTLGNGKHNVVLTSHHKPVILSNSPP